MKKFLSVAKYFVLLGIGIVLLYFAFRGQDFEELQKQFKEAHYEWVVASMLLSLVAYWSRAYRWRLLLGPLGHHPRTSSAFIAVMVGYLANLALPRLGEVLRCTVLNRLERTPVDACIGTVLAERALDLVMLLLLFGATLLLEFDLLSDFVFGLFAKNPESAAASSKALYWMAGGAVLLCLLALFIVRKYQHVLHRNLLYVRVRTFAGGVLKAIMSIRHVERPWVVIFHTVLIWAVYYLMTYIVFWALPETSHLGPLAGLSILMIGGLGMTAPVQGGIGAYHFLVSRGLMLYGVSEAAGLSFATIVHGSQTLLVLVGGGICLLWSMMRLRHKLPEPILPHEQRY